MIDFKPRIVIIAYHVVIIHQNNLNIPFTWQVPEGVTLPPMPEKLKIYQ